LEAIYSCSAVDFEATDSCSAWDFEAKVPA
jgi:hypothetical protein